MSSEDSVSGEAPEVTEKNNRRARMALRVLGIIVGVSIIFAAGVLAGREKLTINGVKESSANKSLPADLDYATVEQVYDLLKSDYDGKLSQEDLLDGLKKGLASSTGDQYTEYFNPEDAKEFNQQLTGSFQGIGAELGKDQESIVIVSPLSGYPADKAGLRAKDVIIKIDGKSTSGFTINQAVKLIRGPKDTTVKLTILRDGNNQFDVSLKRETINIPSVETKIDGNIGYIKITQFGSDTVKLTQQAADDFKAKGVKAVVLDLRNNPGGYLEGAVDVSSLWLDKGKKIVEERRDGQSIRTHSSKGTATLKGIPTVVLINEGSASASEITAGALKDNGAATLVGVKSYGKGSVQQVETLQNGGSLKVTVARWFTPAGKNIDKAGISPDTEVKITDEDYKANRDPQKDKAYELVKQKL